MCAGSRGVAGGEVDHRNNRPKQVEFRDCLHLIAAVGKRYGASGGPVSIKLDERTCCPRRRPRADTGVSPYGSPMTTVPGKVLQLRLVVETIDFDEAVRFYRDVLGLIEQAAFEGDGDARVVILDAGRATLELANPAQVDMIDEIEVGRRVSPKLRVAFEVVDAVGTTTRLVDAGASLVAAPTSTPWRSLNSRLDAPADLHISLFQELGSADVG